MQRLIALTRGALLPVSEEEARVFYSPPSVERWIAGDEFKIIRNSWIAVAKSV